MNLNFIYMDNSIMRMMDVGYGDYESLKRFVTEEMVMHSNYQPVMIITLLTLGKASKSEIASCLREHNPHRPNFDYKKADVFPTLKERNIVRNEGSLYYLNAEALTFCLSLIKL